VRIQYEKLPAIVTIEEAIAANSFYVERAQVKGDIVMGFSQSDHTIEGEVRVGGQEHFYFEPQTCICVPTGEKAEMTVYSSTQAPADTQKLVAKALCVDRNKITCKTKRIGGGFGGKETRSDCVCARARVCVYIYICVCVCAVLVVWSCCSFK
jgi:xanthine dehydrogenase/oxidase